MTTDGRRLTAKEMEQLKEAITTKLKSLEEAARSKRIRLREMSEERAIKDRHQRDNELWQIATDLRTCNLRQNQFNDALKRIEQGTYGICPVCEEHILPKRMLAVPEAVHCTGCAKVGDHRYLQDV